MRLSTVHGEAHYACTLAWGGGTQPGYIAVEKTVEKNIYNENHIVKCICPIIFDIGIDMLLPILYRKLSHAILTAPTNTALLRTHRRSRGRVFRFSHFSIPIAAAAVPTLSAGAGGVQRPVHCRRAKLSPTLSATYPAEKMIGGWRR